MTNEEAREQLKDIARSFSREYFHNWREALDVAIKALEQQPSSEDIKEAYLKGYDYGVKDWFKSKTQPCEDTVDKQIRDCENCIHYKDGGCEVWECKFEAKEGRGVGMSKCRYDLSEDCHSKDCLACVLDKIRSEITKEVINYSGTGEEVIQAYADGLKKGLDIIDKYKAESEDKE